MTRFLGFENATISFARTNGAFLAINECAGNIITFFFLVLN